MTHILYPRETPTECVATLISLIVSGKATEQLDVALKEAWTIQGWCQYVMLGDPDAGPVIGTAEVSAEMKSNLAQLIDVLDESAAPFGSLVDIAIAKIVEQVLAVLIPLIQKWLREWSDKPNGEVT